MIHKIEIPEDEGYDFLLNETLYFSIIGEDKDGSIQVDYSCNSLTLQEAQEIITELVTTLLKHTIKNLDK